MSRPSVETVLAANSGWTLSKFPAVMRQSTLFPLLYAPFVLDKLHTRFIESYINRFQPW